MQSESGKDEIRDAVHSAFVSLGMEERTMFGCPAYVNVENGQVAGGSHGGVVFFNLLKEVCSLWKLDGPL